MTQALPTIKQLASLLTSIKKELPSKEDWEPEFCDIDGDDSPYNTVTIATDMKYSDWGFQSGDNSFTGACYFFPYWEVIYIYKDSNCYTLAKEALNNLRDTVDEANQSSQN